MNDVFRDREGNPVECSKTNGRYVSRCLICRGKIIIHCDDCGIQVSGCACTVKNRAKKEMRDDIPPH
jgi:hypothetical protein